MSKHIPAILTALTLVCISCSPALPNDDPDIKEYRKNEASVKKMLAESYQSLKKSESHLLESKEILKQVKDVEQSIILEKKATQANLAQAKKEKLDADKIRKRAVAEKIRIEKEIQAIKEATPTPTPVPSVLPYSKSDAP